MDRSGNLETAILRDSTMLALDINGYVKVTPKNDIMKCFQEYSQDIARGISASLNETGSTAATRLTVQELKKHIIGSLKKMDIKEVIKCCIVDGAKIVFTKKNALSASMVLFMSTMLTLFTLLVVVFFTYVVMELDYKWPDNYKYVVDVYKMLLPLCTYCLGTYWTGDRGKVWIFLLTFLSILFMSHMQPTEYVPMGVENLGNEQFYVNLEAAIRSIDSYMTGLNVYFTSFKVGEACYRNVKMNYCLKALEEQNVENKVYKEALMKVVKNSNIGLPPEVTAEYKLKNEAFEGGQTQVYKWKLAEVTKDLNADSLPLRAFLQARMKQGQLHHHFYKPVSKVQAMLEKGIDLSRDLVILGTDLGVPCLIWTYMGVAGIPMSITMTVFGNYLKFSKAFFGADMLFWAYDQFVQVYNGYEFPTRMELIEHYYKNSIYNTTDEWRWVLTGRVDLCKVWLCDQPQFELPLATDVRRMIQGQYVKLTANQATAYDQTEKDMNLSSCPHKDPQALSEFYVQYNGMVEQLKLCGNVYSKVCESFERDMVSQQRFCPEHCSQVFFGGTFINITGGVTYQKAECAPCVQKPCSCPPCEVEGKCENREGTREEPDIDMTGQFETNHERHFVDDSTETKLKHYAYSIGVQTLQWLVTVIIMTVCAGTSYNVWRYMTNPNADILEPAPSHASSRSRAHSMLTRSMSAHSRTTRVPPDVRTLELPSVHERVRDWAAAIEAWND